MVLMEGMLQATQVQWANGDFTGETVDETLQLNSAAIGKTRTLAYLTNMDYEDFVGEMSNDK